MVQEQPYEVEPSQYKYHVYRADSYLHHKNNIPVKTLDRWDPLLDPDFNDESHESLSHPMITHDDDGNVSTQR